MIAMSRYQQPFCRIRREAPLPWGEGFGVRGYVPSEIHSAVCNPSPGSLTLATLSLKERVAGSTEAWQ